MLRQSITLERSLMAVTFRQQEYAARDEASLSFLSLFLQLHTFRKTFSLGWKKPYWVSSQHDLQ